MNSAYPDHLPAPSAIAFPWVGPDGGWTADDGEHRYDGADTLTVSAVKTTDRRLDLTCKIFGPTAVPVHFNVKMPDLRPTQQIDVRIDWEKDGIRLLVGGHLCGTKTWPEVGLSDPDPVIP